MQDIRGGFHIHGSRLDFRSGWALCCLLAVVSGCQSSRADSGGLKIQAASKALEYLDISTVTATLTGPGMARPYTIPLGARGANWQAVVVGVPPGTDRMLSAAPPRVSTHS